MMTMVRAFVVETFYNLKECKSLASLLFSLLLLIFCGSTVAAEVPAEIPSLQWNPAIPITNEMEPGAKLRIIEALPTFFFVDDSGVLCQVVILKIENELQTQAIVNLEVNNRSHGLGGLERFVLLPGLNDFTVLLPDERSPGPVEFMLKHDGSILQRMGFDWEPARQWKVYVSQTSHFDHGYTTLQHDVMQRRVEILDTVLEYCTQTDDWPDESKFRWFIESSYCLQYYLQQRPWREAEIAQRIADGRIEISAKLCHMHSTTAGHEELVRNLHESTLRLSNLFDVDIVTAAQNDVVGISWGYVPTLRAAGVRYLSFNPNYFYRGGNILHRTDTPQSYYWTGPGEHEVLTWRSRWSYGEGAFLIDGIDATTDQLPKLLQGYENNPGFPYDAIHLTRTGLDENPLFDYADNSMPRFEVSETIRQWNEIYEYPKLINAPSRQFFEYMEANFSDLIPRLSGDCPDWWADGVITGALAEAEARRVHHKLPEAQLLASSVSIIDDDSIYPKSELDRAWQNTILFDEHTWGYIFPFLPMHDAIWGKKVDDMESAGLTCDDITNQALNELAERIDGGGWNLIAFNALSWERDDIILWQPPPGFPDQQLGSRYFSILDALGEQVPYQIEESQNGEQQIAFQAGNVPSMGYSTYRLEPSDAPGNYESGLYVDDQKMENAHYTITFDQQNGVTGIYDKMLGREFLDAGAPYGFNEFISRKQGLFDNIDFRSSGRIINVYVRETGPVFASVVFEIADPDYPSSSIVQELRLYDGLDRIDILNSVNDFQNHPGESKYFVFPFDVPDFEFHIDIPNGVMQPYYQQLPDFAKYYAVQHWIDVSSPDKGFGITWATVEAPMVEVGEITKKSSWTSHEPPFNYDPGEYPYEPTSPYIFSEIMNNFQNTNFNYDQFGSGTWRYSVMSHAGSWNDGTVTQFGWDLSSPLLVRFYESESDGYLPNALSLVQLDADNVKILALRPAENDDGFIVRLFENCGLDSQVEMKIPILENIQASVVDLAEHELSPLIFEGDAAIIDIGAFELLTLKFDGDCAYSPGDDVDDDNDTEEDDDIDDSGCCG